MTKNILFISMDDCAAYWDYRSVFKEKLQTPNLDRICERASVFRAAYCAAPLCGPSRASLMSGLAPHQSGVVSNNDYVFNHISPKQMWSFDLKTHGYFCSSGGKVHHYFGAMDENITRSYMTMSQNHFDFLTGARPNLSQPLRWVAIAADMQPQIQARIQITMMRVQPSLPFHF